MVAESIDGEEFFAVASTVSPGDEVEYAHAAHDYASPVTVTEVSVTEWLNPIENWWSGTLVIDTGSTEREIVAVEGARIPRDYGSGGPFRLRQFELPEAAELEDPIEVVEPEPDNEREYFTDYANIGEELPTLSGLDVKVPDDVTREDIARAVRSDGVDTIDDACAAVGHPVGNGRQPRGWMRAALQRLGLYEELPDPEAHRTGEVQP